VISPNATAGGNGKCVLVSFDLDDDLAAILLGTAMPIDLQLSNKRDSLATPTRRFAETATAFSGKLATVGVPGFDSCLRELPEWFW